MQSSTRSITQYLKAETWDLHNIAENHRFQKALVRGELPQRLYVRLLGQMLVVHSALEEGLRAWAPVEPAIYGVVSEDYFQRPRLHQDLEYFGADPEGVEPVLATEQLIQRIHRDTEERPIALLGYLYVLEGSNNGARIIAKRVARAYGLEAGWGTAFLDPYGSAQRERWAAFKRDMDAQPFSPTDQEDLVEAAQATFVAVTAIGEELLEPELGTAPTS